MVQLSSMSHPRNPSPQEKRLGADISILGGNRTGIYVQWVKPGSQVEDAGLREGCRLIEVSLGKSSFWVCKAYGMMQVVSSGPQCKFTSNQLEAHLHFSCIPECFLPRALWSTNTHPALVLECSCACKNAETFQNASFSCGRGERRGVTQLRQQYGYMALGLAVTL